MYHLPQTEPIGNRSLWSGKDDRGHRLSRPNNGGRWSNAMNRDTNNSTPRRTMRIASGTTGITNGRGGLIMMMASTTTGGGSNGYGNMNEGGNDYSDADDDDQWSYGVWNHRQLAAGNDLYDDIGQFEEFREHYLKSIRMFGYRYLRPPGIGKTMQAILDEQQLEDDERNLEETELGHGGIDSTEENLDEEVVQINEGELNQLAVMRRAVQAEEQQEDENEDEDNDDGEADEEEDEEEEYEDEEIDLDAGIADAEDMDYDDYADDEELESEVNVDYDEGQYQDRFIAEEEYEEVDDEQDVRMDNENVSTNDSQGELVNSENIQTSSGLVRSDGVSQTDVLTVVESFADNAPVLVSEADEDESSGEESVLFYEHVTQHEKLSQEETQEMSF